MGTAVLATVAATLSGLTPTAAAAPNPVTPGDFTGYGFDQCVAPTQATMDRWMESSPFAAVGIYISGASRGCRSQPNLTPSWISNQQARGWRLLPITLGPQASCHPSFPRYGNDPTINPDPGSGDYAKARGQGRLEAERAVAAAKALGITAGSTLWYDLEGFDITKTHCRESSLAFLSAWTQRLHGLGYVSGTYSSAGSGIKMLDDARVNRPGTFALPDQIWIARWDGVANTSTSYLRSDGWLPGRRMKQYRGGHNETWGGVTINIDSNWLDLGRGSVGTPENHCSGTRVNFPAYPTLRPGNKRAEVRALQCFLKEKGFWTSPLHDYYGPAVQRSFQAWQRARGVAVTTQVAPAHWQRMLAEGRVLVQKTGSAGPATMRAQRALNALGSGLVVNGAWSSSMRSAVVSYQKRVGLAQTGILNTATWQRLQSARR